MTNFWQIKQKKQNIAVATMSVGLSAVMFSLLRDRVLPQGILETDFHVLVLVW